MRVHYDADADAIYIKLGNQKPDGVIELSEGINLDTPSENKIVGIEILHASKKMNIKTILSYELELDFHSPRSYESRISFSSSSKAVFFIVVTSQICL